MKNLVVRPPESGTPNGSAFTLVELLIVIVIIALIAAIALPRFQGFGASNATISATRQLLDDIALARSRAIATRSDVYIVFVPPAITLPNNFPNLPTLPDDGERKVATNVISGQYTTYALFSFRAVGDQPGSRKPRYLSSWKTLPQGTFVATNKFLYNTTFDGVPSFETNAFQFPLATSTRRLLPYIGFDYQGRVFHLDSTGQRVYGENEVIPLARGGIFYPLDANGKVTMDASGRITADVQENPPNNSSTNSTMWTHVVIDWLTGRARIERQEIQ